MPKSQIIKDLVEDNVNLEKSLTRLYVIAKDVNNRELSQWAENELNGYKNTIDAPEYRHAKCSILQYSGINGSFQVKNTPLPQGWIKPDLMNMISDVIICDGIRFVENLALSEKGGMRDLSGLAGEVSSATNGMVSCTSIRQIVPQSLYLRICAEVKTKMIAALIGLEKAYGNLDTLGIDISDKQPIQVDAANADLNRAVFNINIPSSVAKKEPWYFKIAWSIVIPVITTIIGAVITAVVIKMFSL